jgi:hypothetical protein
MVAMRFHDLDLLGAGQPDEISLAWSAAVGQDQRDRLRVLVQDEQ